MVSKVVSSPKTNLATMTELISQAAEAGADLVLFPEVALTGLTNDDDPEHDLPLGQAIPGPITDRLGVAARRQSVYVGTGILEREGNCLYDSAILLGPGGDIVLKYRRIQPQWHGSIADPKVYRQGDELVTAGTRFGTMTFLICGDLFDDSIIESVREIAPNYVLFPFSRNFSDSSFDQEQWQREEEPAHIARAALLNCTTLMVNQLQDPNLSAYPAFGGAMVVSDRGEIVARWPLGKPGILYAEV